MSFDLPKLETADASALLAEMTRRIPAFSSSWTNYNESDPGITLLEMLVWVVEMLAYQADVIPINGYRAMLRWVLGLAHSDDDNKRIEYFSLKNFVPPTATYEDPAFAKLRDMLAAIEAGTPIGVDEMRAAIRTHRMTPYLALTLDDVQQLAFEANPKIAATNTKALQVQQAYADARGGITRLFVLSDLIWLYSPSPQGQVDPVPGTRAICYVGSITPWDTHHPPIPLTQAEELPLIFDLLDSVRKHLALRTLLGNQIAVFRAELTRVSVHCTATCAPTDDADNLAQSIMDGLLTYLQPDAVDSSLGWNYGTAPTTASLLSRIAVIDGVRTAQVEVVFDETLMLGNACLGVNTWLSNTTPTGLNTEPFKGLPQLRYVSVVVAPG